MSKIVEFKMVKGVTVETEGEKWIKKSLEVTVQMPEKHTDEEVHQSLIHAEYILDNWLGQPEEEAAKIPRLDIGELNELSWKKRNKEPAKPSEFAWLFGPGSRDGTEEGAAELVKAIQATKDGKLILGDMEYSLAKDDTFVQRKPHRQEK